MNIDYNSEERYDEEFVPYFPIERILSVKTTDFQNKKPGTFSIDEDIEWNQATLEAFLDVLNFFKERGIQWETFKLSFRARDQSFTSVLLQSVNGLNIFKKMDLHLWFYDRDEYSPDCEYLFPGINQNKQLESLKVYIYGTHRNRFEYDFTTFASHLREMTTLKELKLDRMPHFNQESFSEVLRENKSLENLSLSFAYCNDIADEGISDIVTSLSSHPKLEELQIDTTRDQFGELSSKALQKLLSKTQTLSTLDLYEGVINAEYIIQGLKKNQSLKSLITYNSLYGDLILSRFFQILPHCPNLERLDLCEESMTKTDLEQVIHMDRLQKPIKLLIHKYVIRDNLAIMTKLLHCHPELRLRVRNNFGFVFRDNVELKHINELNWNGRYLMDRSTTSVPLSLWPLVFERVKKKPSIIYEFLKGPSFAARNDSV